MLAAAVLTNKAYYAISFPSEAVYKYSFQCGSTILPPNQVKSPSNSMEEFGELKKAFHAGGNTVGIMGIHNIKKYLLYQHRFTLYIRY